jgi:hypothetical protein
MAMLPEFKSPFLNSICRQVEKRSKAIKYHSREFEWEANQPGEVELLTLNITPILGNYSIFQFTDGNHGWVYVRSQGRKDRGKILFELEDIRLVENAPGIVSAIETTIACSGQFNSDRRLEATDTIRTAWSEVEVRIHER